MRKVSRRRSCTVPLFPCLLALLMLLLVGLFAAPFISCAQAEGQTLPVPSLASDVEDFVAPGYPLYGNDRPYAGFGTMPNAPIVFGGPGNATEQTSQGTSALKDREGERLLEDLKARRAGDRKAEARERARDIRDKALKQAAGTMAFQKAVRHGYGLLRETCEKRALVFDHIFNFRQLLLEGRVLPPVIRWMGPATSLKSGDNAKSVEATYRIESPARIVSRAPTWRDYLMADFAALEPQQGYLPENGHEEDIWKEGVDLGWKEGLEQARQLFELNMARLVADYRGMLRFHLLAQRGMVSMPRLSEGKLGLKVGKRTLAINETVFRITVPAGFLPQKAWLDNRALP